ncbi:MAG: adenylosuccinate synthetase [Planctomycetaceae bacterium]|nr:adenylosuccinate synthetase [Planctomycetaceae bacterium]
MRSRKRLAASPFEPGVHVKRAVITVGLGFGDEGKGATVDFLTRDLGADLVIRYCGGSQAGHNVELPDGRRHTFSQFGAGTLAPNPPRTYLGSAVVIDPPAMLREASHLAELGIANPLQLITVHPRCLVTTPWLRLLNRVRELSRGEARHGSCGHGIGEARSYWLQRGEDAVFAADLLDSRRLHHKLELQRQRILLEAQPLIELCSAEALHKIGADVWELNADDAADQLSEPVKGQITVSEEVPSHQMAILEGAQGVLLDEYRGFHPHTTWSTVTPRHAWELVSQMGSEAVTLLGITRAYSTRHGAGPFPTFSPELTARLADPGNPWNAWQGSLRCGWLDMVMLRYSVAACGSLDGLVVNHLDQLEGTNTRMCDAYNNGVLAPSSVPNLGWQTRLSEQVQTAEPVLELATSESILRTLGSLAPVVVTGYGPTHSARRSSGLSFRMKRD